MAAPAQTTPVPTGPQFDNRRVAAALIDLLIPLAGVVAAYAAGFSVTRGVVMVGVGWTLYYFFALESGDGQTLGKRAMKLRVVSADGTPATMEQIAKRTAVRIVDGHLVGLIVMLATGDRRLRLGDIVAGTVVTDAAGSPAPATPALALAPAPAHPAKPSLVGPPSRKPAAAKARAFKHELSLPPFGRSSRPRSEVSTPAAGASSAKKPSLLKRRLAVPSFARKARRGVAADSPSPIKAGPGPGAAPAPAPGGPAPGPALSGPVTSVQSDRLSEALRAAAPREVQPLATFGLSQAGDPEPSVEVAGPEPGLDLDGPEPAVELDHPEPTVEFERAEPTVEFDRPEAWDEAYEPDPLADLGGGEPVVEVGDPDPGPVPELAADDQAESASEDEAELTIKPIETVSAIDLVMQDAQQRRPAGG